MEIIIKFAESSFTVSVPIENPDVEQVMFALEKMTEKLPFSKEDIEEYILAWAEEINTIRNGKD